MTKRTDLDEHLLLVDVLLNVSSEEFRWLMDKAGVKVKSLVRFEGAQKRGISDNKLFHRRGYYWKKDIEPYIVGVLGEYIGMPLLMRLREMYKNEQNTEKGGIN